jgi:hypothetical protein
MGQTDWRAVVRSVDGWAGIVQEELFEVRVCLEEVEKFCHGRSLIVLGL